MGRVIFKRGARRTFRWLPIAAATGLLLLILSGCTTPMNAVTPIPTQGESTPSASTTSGTTLVATLTPEGANTSGSGTALLQLNPEQQTLCFALHVTGITLPATAAHVHRGAAGTNGPIVVHLAAPNAQGVSTGCTHVSSAVMSSLTQHPADYYVNVHNAPYPEGAVRGQLATCGTSANC